MEKVPESWPTAPTHFTTNKYTYAFQEFVNTYGIPRYREANPALFTAATFPFLFVGMLRHVMLREKSVVAHHIRSCSIRTTTILRTGPRRPQLAVLPALDRCLMCA